MEQRHGEVGWSNESLHSFWFVIGTLLMPLYGGEPVGEGIPEPKIVEIPLNMLFFYSMFLLQSCILFFLYKKPAQQ